MLTISKSWLFVLPQICGYQFVQSACHHLWQLWLLWWSFLTLILIRDDNWQLWWSLLSSLTNHQYHRHAANAWQKYLFMKRRTNSAMIFQNKGESKAVWNFFENSWITSPSIESSLLPAILKTRSLAKKCNCRVNVELCMRMTMIQSYARDDNYARWLQIVPSTCNCREDGLTVLMGKCTE